MMKNIKMKKGLISLISIFMLMYCSVSNAQIVKHVVLISLDGSRPEFYMDTSWPAPNLQKLKSEGVYASNGVKSVYPSITYPSHTTMITGAYPATHKIYYNAPIDGRPGQWYWNADAIRSKTLWEAVKEAGLTSGAVFWPVSVGAAIDYNFPVRRPEKDEKARGEDKITVTKPYLRPKDLLSNIENKTDKNFTVNDLKKKNYSESKTITTISNYILKTYKPNLMAIHLVGIDHAEHAHGTDGPQVRSMVRVTDSLVGTVLQTIKEAGIEKSTAIIITGDHGHTNTKATFAPNVYLAKHGLITAHDWKAKFQNAGGAAFLYLKSRNDKSTLDSVISILKNTREFKENNFKILDRNTLDKMGVNANVALALDMKEGITVRKGTKGKIIKVHKGSSKSTHGYNPDYQSMHTGFIAVGAGIGEHKNITTEMGIKDITPLITQLLGLDLEAPDGKLIPGILSKDRTNKK